MPNPISTTKAYALFQSLRQPNKIPNKMAATLSHIFLPVFLFNIFLTSSFFAHARYVNHRQTAMSTKQQAERLIRSLNLFPKSDINIVEDESLAVDAPALVEKQFAFPSVAGSGPSVQDLGHYAGYYRLPNTKGARMFYFFFESRNKNTADPIVIWLTGGPGCGSEVALFYENGPFHIAKNMSLVWNDYGWDKVSNIIFVDQPTGTGFSYTTSDSDIRHDETGVSNDLYDFLQEFFKAHPQFTENDFFITGESYAGHYIPALASRINKGNKGKEGIPINLKGFAIGNGLTNPTIQYPAYPDYALNMSLIGESDYQSIKSLVPQCVSESKACDANGGDSCESARNDCIEIFNSILNIAGNINYYDIRKQCQGSLCYDFSSMETLLNEKSVKAALGVGDIEFVSCSTDVYYAMTNDWMKNLEVVIPPLIEDGIKMLIYAGEQDLICNWLGNSRWVHAMEWSGKKDFGGAPVVPFLVDGKKSGELKSHGPLAFLKVYEAGHMVPMDQPKAALQMLQSWMQGKLAITWSRHSTTRQ